MTDDELRGRDGELRLSAYYYCFCSTGVVEIDRILAAVAIAGKRYHHTEAWSDDSNGEACVDLIAKWADEAAKALREARLPRED